MRAAFGFLVMVIVMAIGLMVAKQQAKQALPAVKLAASAPAGASAPRNQVEAVGQKVEGLLQQGAARASEAQP